MVIGVDLSDSGCRIAYFENGMEMPESISQVAGGEDFLIPMAIAGRSEMDMHIGREAVRLMEKEGVPGLCGLLQKALDGEEVQGESSAGDMLFFYLVKLLSLTALIKPWQYAERICICAGDLSRRMVELLRSITGRLDYPSSQIDLIGRSESFYEYVMHQKEELWNRDVLLFDCTGKGVTARRMSIDRRMRPAVCTTAVTEGTDVDACDDAAFKAFCESQAEGRIITSVFIAGEQVTGERVPSAMRYLCMKRRVFYAHNVYAKGACHTAMDRCLGLDRRRTYLYLGKDKLRSNVGLRVNRVHDEIYVPLVDAGINWYDVRARSEVYLGRERELRLLLSPLTGKNEHYAVVRLGDIPVRPDHATRVRISLTMESEDFLTVSVEDLGFGEIFPASGVSVTENISVNY